MRPWRSAAERTFCVVASRVGPSSSNGLNRCNAAVSQPYSCIQRKWVSTVCWSYEEKRVAGDPLPRLG
ncbi:hypothetical protein [Micromonospora sp. NPDC005113]